MSRLLRGSEIAALAKGLIHAPKQIEDWSLALTACAVFKRVSGGAVDFGGSEFAPAAKESIAPRKLNESDKYGWWELSEGKYIIEFNEELALPHNCFGILQAHPRLVEAGGWHPVRIFVTRDILPRAVPLVVGSEGLRLKENARISQLIVVEL